VVLDLAPSATAGHAASRRSPLQSGVAAGLPSRQATPYSTGRSIPTRTWIVSLGFHRGPPADGSTATDADGVDYPPVLRSDARWSADRDLRRDGRSSSSGRVPQPTRFAAAAAAWVLRLREEFGPYPLARVRPLLDVSGRELIRRVQHEVGLDRELSLVVVATTRSSSTCWSATPRSPSTTTEAWPSRCVPQQSHPTYAWTRSGRSASLPSRGCAPRFSLRTIAPGRAGRPSRSCTDSPWTRLTRRCDSS
jgi:hypothetical protein